MGGKGDLPKSCLAVVRFCHTCGHSRCTRLVALPCLCSHSLGLFGIHLSGQEARTCKDSKPMTGLI